MTDPHPLEIDDLRDLAHCTEPACVGGYIHEDGEVSICSACSPGSGYDHIQQPIRMNYMSIGSDGSVKTVVDGKVVYSSGPDLDLGQRVLGRVAGHALRDLAGASDLDLELASEPPPRSPVTIAAAVESVAASQRLSSVESEFLAHIVSGLSNAEIAETTGMARPAAKWHMHNLYEKTGTNSREELVRLVLECLAQLVTQ